MKRFLLFSLAAISGLLSFSSLVEAAPTGWTNFKESTTGDIYIGGTPNAEVEFTVGGEATKNLTPNACGLAIWKGGTTAVPEFMIGSTFIEVSNLPTQLIPKCINGVLEEARTANFKTPGGDIVIIGTSGTPIQAVYAKDMIRKVKMNACGFGRLSNLKYGGLTLSFGDLPTETAWICKNGITYKPVQ